VHAVVRRQASWQDCDVFVSGPPGMVRATLRVLAHRTSGEHLYCDPHDHAETRQRSERDQTFR
jgi:NAD(P)H-flavin reductase